MEVKLRVLYSDPWHSQVSAWILSKPVTRVINPIYKVCRIQVLVKQIFFQQQRIEFQRVRASPLVLTMCDLHTKE